MKYRFIAVEGNIGAGKSTLAALLANHYQARVILEEFADNTFLPKFYHEPERYAFPLELSFFADRYKQMKRTLLQQELFHDKIISDYLFIKSKLFARVNLSTDEYELFEKLYEIAETNLPQPDLLIFLRSPMEKLKANIKERGRSYEQQITDSYLLSIEEVYNEFLNSKLQKTLFVDVTNVDFLTNKAHFQQLTSFLEDHSDFETHYLDIQ